MVARDLAKVEIVGSSPIARSICFGREAVAFLRIFRTCDASRADGGWAGPRRPQLSGDAQPFATRRREGVVVDGSRDGQFLTIASQGTYRVRISGPIKKGDFISSDVDGKAKSVGSKRDSSVFGVALQDSEKGLIKAFIFQG